MSVSDLADPGIIAALLAVVSKLGHGILKKLLDEVTGLRADLAAHVDLDEQRHTAVVTALQQRWAAQTPRS